MASNLNEYYASQGQALPSVADRTAVATKAGINGYTGTADQNASLLGYLTNTPNQGGNNVITSDNLAPTTPIQVKAPVTDTSATGINNMATSLVATTKANAAKDQAVYDKQTADLGAAIKASGDTSAFNEKIIADQGVDTKKKLVDNFTSQIEQEQHSLIGQINDVKLKFGGLTSGASDEIDRLKTASANRVANYSIGLSAASRDYESASNIANRLISANTDKIKADIQSRQFILQQLGTKLATEQSNAFNLQLKQIDKEDSLYKDAIKTATDGAHDGTIDGNTAFKAVQDLTAGKISISQFYTELGVTNGAGNINGYDITSYATDPQHEIKVQAIYDTLPTDVKDEKTADTILKGLSPKTPITGLMVMNASQEFHVDPKLVIALMQQDSSLGTAGLGVKTKNPGNVGNDDAGNTQTFKTWDEGVNAVAKWLSGHKSKGIYRGEFQGTLETVVNAVPSVPDVTRKAQLASLKKYIANGDYKTAYTQIVNTVANTLQGDNKTQFVSKRDALPAIEDLQAKLQAYADANGNTGLLKGTYEQIYNKLGAVADPKFKTLAADLRISLQQYRHNMSGAAFSAQEAKDYESVNPSGTNSLDLNLAILDGMHNNFKRTVDGTVDSVAGDGAQYIRQYAESGTSPQTAPQNLVMISTPAGNSFSIISN